MRRMLFSKERSLLNLCAKTYQVIHMHEYQMLR
ncbi:uncharacterized protein METZ01_LOCUS148942 [marine metagenome]|uniref:Uncharacterized protein n=1 Tax=marine metagenome TaxID=408172 RepID=A0A382A3G8_9ZZZZ